MTDEHAPFLSAIRAKPDEDAPRLIYADWLEEQGESNRAEFIRLQCERARLPEYPHTEVMVPYLPDVTPALIGGTAEFILTYLERLHFDVRPGEKVRLCLRTAHASRTCLALIMDVEAALGHLPRSTSATVSYRLLSPTDEDVRSWELDRQCHELLETDGNFWAWLGVPRECIEDADHRGVIRYWRGLPARYSCTPEHWYLQGHRLQAAWPLERVELFPDSVASRWIRLANLSSWVVGWGDLNRHLLHWHRRHRLTSELITFVADDQRHARKAQAVQSLSDACLEQARQVAMYLDQHFEGALAS